ncbi:MAG: hypothetical protein ACUVTD_05415 [Nitrososphaerales archaeon]
MSDLVKISDQPKGVCERCGSRLYALAEQLVTCEGCKKMICFREPEIQLPCCAIKYDDLHYCPECIKEKFNLSREAFKALHGICLGLKDLKAH